MAIDTFVAFDTETTGLSFTDDRVIQFGCTVFVRRKAVFKTSMYIQTDVPNGGFHINQITDEQIAGGEKPEDAFLVIASVLHKTPHVVCAYNAPFDLMMLASEFRRYGIKYDYSILRVLDPLVIHKHFNPYWPAPRNKLVYVCDKYRIPYEGTHDAGDDCEAAGHLFLAQQTNHCIRDSALNLHRKQLRWHDNWATSFIEWGAKRGREITVTPWPCEEEMICSPASEQLSLGW